MTGYIFSISLDFEYLRFASIDGHVADYEIGLGLLGLAQDCVSSGVCVEIVIDNGVVTDISYAPKKM